MSPGDVRSFTVATDVSLCELIESARDRIVFVAPGITETVAQALGLRLADERMSVTVILDNDPEVYRLGLGTIEGLDVLKKHAESNMSALRCQQGVRIGLLISDDRTLVYSPTPQLIEAGSTSAEKPNAVLLRGAVTDRLCEASGASDQARPSDGEIGTRALKPSDIALIQENVKTNPPEPFDLTRKARVFSSQLQFVEFTVEKYKFTAQTVPVPAYLMGLAGEMQDRWHNNLRLMDMKATEVELDITDSKGKTAARLVDQKFLDLERKRIEEKYLIPVVGFGSVMFKSEQKHFEAEAGAFSQLLAKYFEKLKAKLGESLSGLATEVVARLLPSVIANPPTQYTRHGKPDEADIAEFLQRDIESAINAKTLMSEPKIKTVYKDIAYQSVKSDDFRKVLKAALMKRPVSSRAIESIFRESTAVLPSRMKEPAR